MKLSNELAKERYERLRFGLEEDQKIIEVANLDELREEGKRILKENMKEDYKVCIFAHCILDDNKHGGTYNLEDVRKSTYDELVDTFVKLTSVVRMKGIGMNFESDKGTEGYIIVCNGI